MRSILPRHRARPRRAVGDPDFPPEARRALVLAAGGVTGALYEVGVLRAFEERLGAPHEHFDLFVGVSGGASIAAFVAQGVLPSRLYRALLRGDDPLFSLRQRDVAALDLSHALRLAWTSARLLARGTASMLRRRATSVAETRAAETSLPSGLFSLEPYRRFLAATLRANGLADGFRGLPRRLLVPATDLDSTERVVFGAPPWDDVPISAAVTASSAIPVFFEPVEVRGRQFIDGDVGRAAHLDLVVAAGAREVLLVSPLVPARNVRGSYDVPGEARSRGSLGERGMWAIFNQAHRIEHEARLQLGIERARLDAPWLRLQVVEPVRGDATLFLANPMSLAARSEVLAKGFARGLRVFSRIRARRSQGSAARR
jgi:NTE family protein